MTTYAILISRDYMFDELRAMNSEELFNFASSASSIGYDEAAILTLEEFTNMVNNDEITTEGSWLFFVNREEK